MTIATALTRHAVHRRFPQPVAPPLIGCSQSHTRPGRWLHAHTHTHTHINHTNYARSIVDSSAHLDEFIGSWSADVAPLPPTPPPLQLTRDTPTTFHQDALLVRGLGPKAHLEHEGTVVVLGDVDQTAHVSATGDVLIWGDLRGTCHAGSGGNTRAIVLAAGMRPTSLRIAKTTAHPHAQPLGAPVLASIDQITELVQLQRVPSLTSLHAAAKDKSAPPRPLTPAGRVAWFTGLYITLAGIALLVKPVELFGLLFDASAVPVGWIRVGAVLCVLFGSYYLGAAWGEQHARGLTGFYESTVAGRLFLVAAFVLLVVTGQVGMGLLVLAGVNLLGAVNMFLQLGRTY